jgi:hypothetical protein
VKLTLNESFEVRKFKQIVEDCNDVAELKRTMANLIDCYFMQKAAIRFYFMQTLPSPLNFNCNTDESSKVS